MASKERRPHIATRAETQLLRLEVEPLQGSAAARLIGATPEIAGVTPIRVRVQNNSERLYRLRARRVKLITQEGHSTSPLPTDEVMAALAPEWRDPVRKSQLTDTDIAPGTTVDGYVFVPAAAYQRAKVILIEAESEEAEGFSVEF